MTLDEKVSEYAWTGKILHVGSSSGWIFIGTAERYRAEIASLTDAWGKLHRDMVEIHGHPLHPFTPFCGREVIKEYERTEPNTVGIIIEGYEHGIFWMQREYDRATVRVPTNKQFQYFDFVDDDTQNGKAKQIGAGAI